MNSKNAYQALISGNSAVFAGQPPTMIGFPFRRGRRVDRGCLVPRLITVSRSPTELLAKRGVDVDNAALAAAFFPDDGKEFGVLVPWTDASAS